VNDPAAVAQTGERRAINRHNFSTGEVEAALQKPVVRRLLRLIRFRNTYPAFNGEFAVLDSTNNELRLSWRLGEQRCELHLDLQTSQAMIDYLDSSGRVQHYAP
jgi:sucrose phosphorylase